VLRGTFFRKQRNGGEAGRVHNGSKTVMAKTKANKREFAGQVIHWIKEQLYIVCIQAETLGYYIAKLFFLLYD